jgi:ABC-type microcin C transport system permease subunit YejE
MLGFLIAAAAGFLTPQLEGPVAVPVMKALEGHIPVTDNEKRLIAFMVALLAAAVLAAAFNTGSVFGIIVGAILGYFGPRIFAALKTIIDGRPKSD